MGPSEFLKAGEIKTEAERAK